MSSVGLSLQNASGNAQSRGVRRFHTQFNIRRSFGLSQHKTPSSMPHGSHANACKNVCYAALCSSVSSSRIFTRSASASAADSLLRFMYTHMPPANMTVSKTHPAIISSKWYSTLCRIRCLHKILPISAHQTALRFAESAGRACTPGMPTIFVPGSAAPYVLPAKCKKDAPALVDPRLMFACAQLGRQRASPVARATSFKLPDKRNPLRTANLSLLSDAGLI